jgi:predicted ATPase
MLDVVSFAPITIFYGSNGSGKSTLLNVIAEKINIQHKTLGNISPSFDDFVEKCTFEMEVEPKNSRFIKSEDIMEAIAILRRETKVTISKIKTIQNYTEIDEEDGVEYKLMGEKEMQPVMEKYHNLSEQHSNGETAMLFFENIFEPDTLYLLDEPENSLSPRLQLALKKIIEETSYLLDCQFIIATHSPFLLSIEHAKIYNLDATPVTVERWYELENVRYYYDFFKMNKDFFASRIIN